MADDDATQMIATPDLNRLTEQSRVPDLNRLTEQSRVPGRGAAQRLKGAPSVGVRSVGETYFGDTQAGPEAEVEQQDRPKRGAHGGLSPAGPARPNSSLESPSQHQVPSLTARTNPRSIALLLVVVVVVMGGLWLGQLSAAASGSRVDATPKAIPESPADQDGALRASSTQEGAVVEQSSEASQAAEPKDAEAQAPAPAPKLGDPEEARTTRSPDPDEPEWARRAIVAIAEGHCGEALELYRRLSSQRPPHGAAWIPYLVEARRSCPVQEQSP